MQGGIFYTISNFTSSAPVDVKGMAEALGIEVHERTMPENRSGSIEKIAGRYIITVNKEHSSNRKRFTIAHEIGHFVFHDHLICTNNGIFDDKMYRDNRISSSEETEANRFAVSILIPTPLLDPHVADCGVENSATLPARFQVSEKAMEIRLQAYISSGEREFAFPS